MSGVAGISQLAYLGLGVSDLEEWRTFALCLGAEFRRGNAADRAAIRVDERVGRLWLQERDTDSLAAVGWEAPSRSAMNEIVDRVRAWGIAVSECTQSYASDRGYDRIVRFRDPAGLPTEIACTPIEGPEKFMPSRAITGFSAGAAGLGHLFVYVADLAEIQTFYEEVLGFRTSDFITWPEAGIDAVFLRCNARHHSIAFAVSESSAPGHLEHVMLETLHIDDVGAGLDLLLAKGFAMATSLGRHINDNMLSFYVSTPSGFWLEYGCGAVSIEDESSWEVKRYTNGHTWGHAIVGGAPRLLPFEVSAGP